MKIHPIAALILAAGLSGCIAPDTGVPSSTDPAQVTSDISSAASLPQVVDPAKAEVMQSQYDVQEINVIVPTTLRVSEANTWHPKADIVWRGDPPGDRYAQVKAIFETAMAQGTATMHSGPKVALDIEVTYFHCLTEKTRYTIGGVHSMKFIMTVRDLETGEILQGPRKVNADVVGVGGAMAIAEDAAGRTQKVVVTERLAQVIRQELSVPVTSIPQDALVTRYDGSPVELGASQTE